MYSEYATDAKVQSMPEHMQRRLVMLFCLRCCDVTVTLSDEDLAFQLRISDEDLAETKQLFLRKGFINEDWDLVNWDKRQFVSDSSTERTRAYRQRKKEREELLKKQAETSRERHSDALDTDTDTEQNQIQKQKKKTTVSANAETAQVFDYWKQKLNHPNSQLDNKRVKAISGRLKDGYTVGQLCQAIDGCKNSRWHQGENDRKTVYDDIELICRDGPNVDRFIGLANKTDDPFEGLSKAGRQTALNGQQWLEEMNARQ